MRKRIRHIITIISTILFFSSCTEIVEIDLDSTYTRLVVYGSITTDSTIHKVQLSKSTDYFFTEEPPPVSDALVEISFENTNIILEEMQDQPGVYVVPYKIRGKAGVTYELNISGIDINEDGESENYQAITQMPGISRPDSLSLLKFITPFFSGYQLAFWSPDPEGRNWYKFNLSKNGVALNDRLSDFTVQPDDIAIDGYIKGVPIGFLDDEEEEEALLPGDTVMLEVNSITEKYYNFITQAQSEIFGNNPLFSGPPANVTTNLNNNAQGIFTAYSIERVLAYAPAFPVIPQ